MRRYKNTRRQECETANTMAHKNVGALTMRERKTSAAHKIRMKCEDI